MRVPVLFMAAAAATACAAPLPAAPAQVQLSSDKPSAVLSWGRPAPNGLLIDVIEVINPTRLGVTITLVDNGRPPRTDSFALYPPDRPGRFTIRTARGATAITLRLVGPANLPEDRRVKLLIRAAPR